jgi:dGTPase
LLVTDLMNEVRARVALLSATTLEDIRCAPSRIAALSPQVESDRAEAKQFLYDNFYNSPIMEEAHEHATAVVQGLFAALIADPAQLPPDHRAQIPTQGLARTVADYIAGMTDSLYRAGVAALRRGEVGFRADFRRTSASRHRMLLWQT